jgi:hypothetical protein
VQVTRERQIQVTRERQIQGEGISERKRSERKRSERRERKKCTKRFKLRKARNIFASNPK